MSIFLKFYSFFITIGVPAYQAHGHWTQYYVRTDSYDFCSFTQPLNVRKTSPNWEKNIKDGLQNFQHIIFNGKCWTDRLDLSMNENRNLFYGLRGVSLIFCGKFGAWELPNSYQKPWEMGWQQFYRNLEYLEKKFFLRVKNHFGGSITPGVLSWIPREVAVKISAKSVKKWLIHSKLIEKMRKISDFRKKHFAHGK